KFASETFIRSGRHSGRHSGLLATQSREAQTKARPLSGITLDFDLTAVFLHNVADDDQAQPGAFAPIFCRVKRFEDMRLSLARHAAAGGGDVHHDLRPAAVVRRGAPSRSACRDAQAL